MKAATALKPVGLGKDPARFGLSNLRPALGMHPPAVTLKCVMGASAQPSRAGAGDGAAERHDPRPISNNLPPTVP